MTQPIEDPPPTPAPTRAQRFAQTVVAHLPAPLIRDTERVMLNAATGIVGVTSLLALQEPGTIAVILPAPLLVMWSATLIAGSVFVLYGMFRARRPIERAGLMLTGIGCLIYAAALFSVGGPRAQIIGGLFLLIAATKGIRLLTSTAGGAIAAARWTR